MVVRYGGEEFVILFPGATKAVASRQAETIRRAVETHPFKHAARQPLGAVTISGGVASFPEDARNSVALLRAADQALYEAKAAGPQPDRHRVADVRRDLISWAATSAWRSERRAPPDPGATRRRRSDPRLASATRPARRGRGRRAARRPMVVTITATRISAPPASRPGVTRSSRNSGAQEHRHHRVHVGVGADGASRAAR